MSKTNLPQKPKFSVAITTEKYRSLVNNTLSDPERAKRFIATITSSVAVSPALQKCDAGTILAGALLGESLNLSPSPQLGQFYLVPFECRIKDQNGKTVWLTDPDGNFLKDDNGRKIAATEKRAQFVIGYKGYIQLAIRSGYYKHINVLEVKQGEFISYNPFTEEFSAKWYKFPEEREQIPTVGYVAVFEYLNGFKKLIYWTKDQMIRHAETYSHISSEVLKKIESGEIPDEEMWKYSSFWYKNFDAMGKKTMLRQLISKWGVMSIEMQKAFEGDYCISDIDGNSFLPEAPDREQKPTSDSPILPPGDNLIPNVTGVVEKIDLNDV